MLNRRRSRKTLFLIGLGLILAVVCAALFVPTVQMHLNQAFTWVRGALVPVGNLPTAETEQKSLATEIPSEVVRQATETNKITVNENPVPLPTALPQTALLPSPAFNPKKDYQDWNNCGPATLALDLRFWGWQGDQTAISSVVKPERQDKNVNIDELAAYVNSSTAGLQAEIRVGGDLDILKKFLAAGFPVVIEESFKVEKIAWPGDDLWASHFLMFTGYDDKASAFTVQDVYYGPDRQAAYDDVERDWQSFNHIYLVVFPTSRIDQVRSLFGADWDTDANTRRAINALQSQLQLEPGNAYAWFNLGTNLVSIGDYPAAASAFKTSRQLGLPQRMLRYQFGPFIADFQTRDFTDLTQLLDYALKITPDSEEAFYWKGQQLLQAGDKQGASFYFREALKANPNYQDAKIALKGINSF